MVIASRSLNVEVLLRKFARALLNVVPFNYKVSIVVLCQVQIVITDNQVIYNVRRSPNFKTVVKWNFLWIILFLLFVYFVLFNFFVLLIYKYFFYYYLVFFIFILLYTFQVYCWTLIDWCVRVAFFNELLNKQDDLVDVADLVLGV